MGDYVVLEVTGLKTYVKYYFAIAGRDNVTLPCGHHSEVSATPGILYMPDMGPGTMTAPALPFHPAPPCQRS